MRDVFISYSTKDEEIANKIYQKLSDSGIECFLASHSIEMGTMWVTEIVRALKECSVFLLVVSDSSSNSAEVGKEVTMASTRRKTIIPVNIDKGERTELFEYHLVNTQWFDALPDPDIMLEEIVANIKVKIKKNAEDGSNTSENKKVSRQEIFKNPKENDEVEYKGVKYVYYEGYWHSMSEEKITEQFRLYDETGAEFGFYKFTGSDKNVVFINTGVEMEALVYFPLIDDCIKKYKMQDDRCWYCENNKCQRWDEMFEEFHEYDEDEGEWYLIEEEDYSEYIMPD